jgi:RHS repeat-associated protein
LTLPTAIYRVFPDRFHHDAHIPTRLCGRRELFLHGGHIRTAADPDEGALPADFGGKEHRYRIKRITMSGPATWQARPGWGIADAPYSCYDRNGNMVRRDIVTDTYNLAYDAENRLVQVSGAAAATFGYDGDGKRVIGVEDSKTTVYIGNYFEWHGTITDTIKYYYAGTERVAMKTGSANPKWLVGDHLGSTSVVANYDGTLYARQGYYAWGERRFLAGVSPLPTTFRFTGQRESASFGMYYYGARWYDSSLGRFIQPDTIIPEKSQGVQAWDRYAYVNNSPVNYMDPTGHMYDSGCNTEGCDTEREKRNNESNPVIEKLEKEHEKEKQENSRDPKLPYKNNQMTCTNNQCKIGYAIVGTGFILIGALFVAVAYLAIAGGLASGQWEVAGLAGLIGGVAGALFILGGVEFWKKSGCLP